MTGHAIESTDLLAQNDQGETEMAVSQRRRAISRRWRAATCRVMGHRIASPYRWASWCSRCYRPSYAVHAESEGQS